MRLLLVFCFWLCATAGAAPCRAGSAPASAAAGISYLALGDSYTNGQGLGAAKRWPVQLAALARQRGVSLQDPTIIARTGWTTAALASAIGQARPTGRYDLVTLQIGVNNQYRGQSAVAFRSEFRQLLLTAVRLAGNRAGRVVVLSVPDWGQSPFAAGRDRARIGAEIDRFNAEARQESQTQGVAFVDITPLTRAAADNPAQFTPDRLHYSGAHLRLWAQQALPVAETALLTP